MFTQRERTKMLLYLATFSIILALSAGTAQAAAPSSGQRAQIALNVPLDAIVWVNGVRTRSTGLTRTFVTPPLAPGRKYSYDLRITYVEGGRTREIERRISFRPGDRLLFNFAQPNWTQTSRDLYLDPAAPAPWGMDYYQDPLNSPNYPNFLFPGSVLRPR